MNKITNEEGEFLVELGKQVEMHRKKKKLTQSELALRIGTKHSQIGRIERGESSTTIIILRRIAKELEIKIEELVKLD